MPPAPPPSLWARVGGGLEEVPGGRRWGPADPALPPPGTWVPLWLAGQLVGWAEPGSPPRSTARRAVEEGARILEARRSHLIRRLGHKLRGSALACQETARLAAFGRAELLEQVYELAQDVSSRAAALEAVALEPTEAARRVVLGAVLGMAAAGATRSLPDDALVRGPEALLVEAFSRACEWMGGRGSRIVGEACGRWWRIRIVAAPGRRPLPVPELGEPLVRHLVDHRLGGWLDSSDLEQAVIYLPAA
jgi:hypothetical protein